jgi:uncharacterized protein (TIGR02271 family)
VIGQNMVNQLYDCEVFDSRGEKVGSVKQVWVDDQTGDPMWASVHTGMFGKESFVPLQSAELREHEVRVSVDKERIKESPKIDASHDHISDTEQAELLRYYGFGPQRSSPENASMRQAGQRTGERSAQQNARQNAMPTGKHAGRHAETATSGQATGDGTGQRAGMDRQSGRTAATGDLDGAAMTRSEERLRVRTEQVETGKVRLVKRVVTEEQQVSVPVTHEEIRIEHEPITAENRTAAMSGTEITEAEHEVTLHAEKPMVEKETVPVERVRLTKEQVTDTETLTGEVRKEEIAVEDDRRGRRAL